MGDRVVTLGLDHITTITIRLDEQHIIGMTPRGLRRVSPILSGSFDGPRLRGKVLPGGADWNLVLPDGSIEFDARRIPWFGGRGSFLGVDCTCRTSRSTSICGGPTTSLSADADRDAVQQCEEQTLNGAVTAE